MTCIALAQARQREVQGHLEAALQQQREPQGAAAGV
jgi:hypothetical protein